MIDPVTWAQLRAEEDEWLIGNLRRLAFTPPQRGRIEEIGNALRAKPELTRREAWILREIDAFWEQWRENLKAFCGPHALEG